jgi:hypothetical protein
MIILSSTVNTEEKTSKYKLTHILGYRHVRHHLAISRQRINEAVTFLLIN